MKDVRVTDMLFGFLLILLVGIGYLLLRPGHNLIGDYALYVRQAQSIINGDALQVRDVMKFMLENSSDNKFSPILYPWGFPILLAPVYLLFGLNFYAFKIYELLFYTLGIVFIYLLFRQKREFKWQAFFIALLIGMQHYYLSFLNLVLTEMPYLFFVMLSMYLLNRVYVCKTLELRKMPAYAGMGVLLMFTAQIRTEGIFLFAALGVWLFIYFLRNREEILKNRQNVSRFLVTAIMPFVAGALFYLVLNVVLPSGFLKHTEHFDLLTSERVLSNLQKYFAAFGKFAPFSGPLMITVFLLLALWGMIRCFGEDTFEAAFVSFSVLLLIVWPHQNTRHLFVLLPFFWYFVCRAIESMGRKKYRFQPTAVILFICFLFALPLTWSLGMEAYASSKRSIPQDTDSEQTRELVTYVQDHIPPEETIGFAHSRCLYLLSGRKTLVLWGDMKHTLSVADWYVCCARWGNYFQHAEDELVRFEKCFEERFRNTDYIIYKTHKDAR